MTRDILDSSALLAYLRNEPGAEQVGRRLRGSVISAVNLAEVLTRLSDEGAPDDAVEMALNLFAVSVQPFDAEGARGAAALRAATRQRGLSLGDRACLALAAQHGSPALTADRAWAGLDLDIEVVLIR